MEFTDVQLQEFKDRCLMASVYGYEIANADLYVAALAKEVGQEVVPEDVVKGSAAHLLGLAQEALEGRSGGHKKKGKKAKAEAETKKEPEVKPEPKVEPKTEAKTEKVETKVEPKTEKVEAKTESKDEDKEDDKKKSSSKK